MMKGILVERKKVLAYVFNATLAGLSGLIIAAQMNVGAIGVGGGCEMNVIAAVVIGGTFLSGGFGKVFNSAIGMVIITLIGNAITMKGNISWLWQSVATSALLIVILMVQAVQSRRGG